MKGVTSTNPLKKVVVNELKRLSGGNKVTMVQEDQTHFHGTCMAYDPKEGKYKQLGKFSIEKSKVKA